MARLGAVVDHLDFHWQDWHWPAFNLADVFVVGGAGLLSVGSFFEHRAMLTCWWRRRWLSRAPK